MTLMVAVKINAMLNILRPRQDDHHFAYHFQIHFIQTKCINSTTKSLQFFPKGAVDYQSKLLQTTAWRRIDTKPLPESVVIQINVDICVSRIH